jgi:hypothetical protein
MNRFGFAAITISVIAAIGSTDVMARGYGHHHGYNGDSNSYTMNQSIGLAAAANVQSNNANSNSNSNTNSNTYDAQKRNPVATAFASPLVTSNDTCMGSTSAGGQLISFGLSIGTTWRDKDCVLRKDARFLYNTQRDLISLAMMCQKESVRKAVALAGTVQEKDICGVKEDLIVPRNPGFDDNFNGKVE